MDLTGKKIVMLVAPENFRDEECLQPKEIFENAGAEVKIASKGVSEAKGMLGATIKVDMEYTDVNVGDFDAVVFVGGSGAAIYLEDAHAQKIADDFFNAGKPTAAICIAPTILANAGLLVGRKATSYPSEKEKLEDEGATFTGGDVEVDANLVTANGPKAAKQFGEEIAKLLG